MELSGAPGLGHLTYCTNIHAAESWPDVLAGLREHLPAIKAEISPGAPFGVGLRLSAEAAEALGEPDALDELRGLLADGGYYVFTINGFPYGAFHGRRVKEGVYQPDWSEDARLVYTNRLADLLAEILPDGMKGSISTVPGTFKPWADGRVEAITDNMLRHAAHLVAVRERTGKTLVLAPEPEPSCLFETIEETIAFFETQLLSRSAVDRIVELTGLSPSEAEQALRRHLGVCYDVCHAAVEFEDPADSVARLRAAGISARHSRSRPSARRPKTSSAPSTSRSICIRWCRTRAGSSCAISICPTRLPRPKRPTAASGASISTSRFSWKPCRTSTPPRIS